VVNARADECSDVRIEPDASHIEEQMIAELTRIDDASLC